MNILKYTIGIVFFGGLVFSCNPKDAKNESIDAHAGHNHGQQVTAPVEDQQKATISFETMEFDFGTINEGEVVSHTFKFTNTGEVPLIIQNASPSCGCTVPDWSKDPIPPGGTGQIDVKFDSKGKSNVQNRSVNVVANTEPSLTILRIKGNVVPKEPQAMGPVRTN